MLSPFRIRRTLALIGLGGIIAAGITLPHANAYPGQCGGGFALGNGGDFCDGPVAPDGTWLHQERVCVLGICGWNQFRVRPVPLDVDPRGWVPA